jgi:mannosyltransferase
VTGLGPEIGSPGVPGAEASRSKLATWRATFRTRAGLAAWVRSARLAWAVPLGLLALACLVRAFHLGFQSLWIDELEEGTVARLPLDQLLASVRSSAGDSPLDDFGVRLVTSPFPHPGTIETRLWAFMVGSAAVLIVFLAAKEAFQSRTAGVVAALVLAFMPVAVFYSQEARPYALVMLMAALNLWLFARALRVGGWAWAWFCLSVTLAIYTHYYLALLVIGELVTLVVLRKAWGCVALILGGAANLPWAVYAVPHQLGRPHDYATLAPFSVTTLFKAWTDVLSPTAERGVVLAGLALLAAGLAAAVYGRSPAAFVAGFACLIAIPFAWSIDVHGSFYFSVRQVMFVLPCLAILVGGASTMIRPREVALLLAAWLLLQVPGLRLVYAGDWMPKEDWRASAAFVAGHIHPDSVIYSWIGAGNSFGVGYYQAPTCVALPLDRRSDRPLRTAAPQSGRRDCVG